MKIKDTGLLELIWVLSIALMFGMYDPMSGVTIVFSGALLSVSTHCERKYQAFCQFFGMLLLVMTFALTISNLMIR